MNTREYFYLEKIFHRLESDSARNNIHPNNKQKPEITNKAPEKNMSIWPRCSRGDLASTARSLRFFLLEALRFS